MPSVTMLQAQSSLPRLVDAIERGLESEIIISRDGKPVAKLVPVNAVLIRNRIGIAKGLFQVPDDIDTDADEVARLFSGDGAF